MPFGKTNFYLFSLQNYNHFPFLQNILKLFSSKTEEIVIILQIYPHFRVFKSAETGIIVPSDSVMPKKVFKMGCPFVDFAALDHVAEND